jgi:hypothetical protein
MPFHRLLAITTGPLAIGAALALLIMRQERGAVVA